MTQNTEKQTTDEGSGLFDFFKKHPHLGRVMAMATLVVSLAPVFPTTVLAGWCGPTAPENFCGSCRNIDSDCGGDTCFAEKIGSCREVLQPDSSQSTFEYAVPVTQSPATSGTWVPLITVRTACVNNGLIPTIGPGISLVDAMANARAQRVTGDPCPPIVVPAKHAPGWKVQFRKPAN